MRRLFEGGPGLFDLADLGEEGKAHHLDAEVGHGIGQFPDLAGIMGGQHHPQLSVVVHEFSLRTGRCGRCSVAIRMPPMMSMPPTTWAV